MYGGEIYKLREHTERLFKSAEMLDFEIPFTVEEIDQACKDTCAKNGLTDAYLRPIAWRGSEMIGVSAQNTKIHVAIAVWDWPSYFSPEERQGHPPDLGQVQAPVAGDRAGPRQGHRPLHDLHHLQARRREGRLHRRDDARLSAATSPSTGSNVFFVKDGALHTPTPDCFLNGITRQSVIALTSRASR